MIWVGFLFPFILTLAQEGDYELEKVRGMEAFAGSAEARLLLRQNGFVVADPMFKQIFEAYIKSPEIEPPSEDNPHGSILPVFITTDSAWHTYHLLLEEGVRELEAIQAERLLRFSRRLLAATQTRAPQLGPSAGLLRRYASVGLALQEAAHRQTLTGPEKNIVDGLRAGQAAPLSMEVGFPLSPAQFRAQSFYAGAPPLADYFTARQWYATVVFRLNHARETQAAVALATLIAGDAELSGLWQQLSDPFDRLLARAEDGAIPQYAAVAGAVAGTNPAALSAKQLAAIQDQLAERLPLPRVNDQLLQPEEYAQFGKLTRGFRLLPPRQLPCAVCFQQTTDPEIPDRWQPSGLDYFAAAPELRSPAALRAVQSQFGKKIGDRIAQVPCGSLPDSLFGEAMRLLARLQEPRPPQVAPALRTAAWHDRQLWTQLGAWAEQRHTWALHTKLNVLYLGLTDPPTGMVTPYPEFFAGLAKLARATATALDQAGLDPVFDARTAAASLREMLQLFDSIISSRDERELEQVSGKLEQLEQFTERYYERHKETWEKAEPQKMYQRMRRELKELAERGTKPGPLAPADQENLRLFFDCRQNAPQWLRDFAPVCDQLAVLAGKSLTGEPLTKDNAEWMANYGITLARFHFYYGNAYLEPRDDFPKVTRIFSNPLTDSMLYAGVARPQALYVIVPGENALQLYRGAVLTYREFTRPTDQPLDDAAWRELIAKGETPPAPPFTRSFYAETTVATLLEKLRGLISSEDATYRRVEDLLWQLGARATAADLPALFEMLPQTGENAEVAEALVTIISRLPWESRQNDLIAWLGADRPHLAITAAHILASRPSALDVPALISAFPRQSALARRLTCVLLSRVPQPSASGRALLLQALRDPADGVRWQAALAIYQAGWNEAESRAALLQTLDDTNEIVGAAAAYALGKLGATNAAPVLLAKLRERLQVPPLMSENASPSVRAVTQDLYGMVFHTDELLDVDNLRSRLERTAPPPLPGPASQRRRFQPFDRPTHNFNLADALIEALGALACAEATEELFKLRDTVYQVEATRALARLAPDRLTRDLLATARDPHTDSYLRERALITLGDLALTNCVRELVPLLDDTTPIEYSRAGRGPAWRVCDRAAQTMATLLGWEHPIMILSSRPELRAALIARARAWAETNP